MNRKIHFVAMIFAISFCSIFNAKAQTKIKDGSISGTTIFPVKDAILELESSNRGLLYPRVGLVSTDNAAPLSAHVKGMVVYDTASAGSGATAVTPGLYYNDGNQWVRIGNSPTDWYQFGSTVPASNADSQYVMGRVAIGNNKPDTVASSSSNSSTAQQLAKLTVAGGDASINGITVGRGGGQDNTCVAIGSKALYNNQTNAGAGNIAIGANTLTANTTGQANIGIGYRALEANTTGVSNVAIGQGNLMVNTTGGSNTAIGDYALINNTSGIANIGIGLIALGANTSGRNNVAIGTQNLYNNTTGSGNISIGTNIYTEKSPVLTGNYNILIGYSDDWSDNRPSTEPAPNGHIRVPNAAGNNQMNIGNAIFGADMTGTDYSSPAGRIGIGTAIPDNSAVLDVNAANKGVLLPRVALASSTDITTIHNPATGLLVYNTGANPSFTTIGYMYWNGTSWKMFSSGSADPATATLNCAGSQMNPGQQVTGGTAIISGSVLQIPYTGGNGGAYNGATLVSTGNPNVTAIISPGILGVGNGMINATLSGTPTVNQQAPNGITFDITPFLNANTGITGCNSVTVGNTLSASVEETAVMGSLMLTTDNTGNDVGTQYYALTCNSPDGKWSARVEVPVTQTSIHDGNQYLNIQLRNNQSTAVPIIWNFFTFYGNNSLGNSGVLTVPAMRWGGDQNSGDTWTNATGSNSSNGAYWGQVGIYDASNNGPEYRRYTWIPIGANNKVSYEITVMAALDTTTPTTAVPPGKVKAYIKFEQVTAVQ